MNEEQIEQLQAPLDPAHVKRRKQGDMMLSYIEGWRAIKHANEIFGFDGWVSELMHLQCVESSTQGNPNYKGRGGEGYLVAYTATVRVMVDGVGHTDVGYGEGIEYNNVGQAHESAVKEAVTDAEKRALRHWGNQFGLSLYDKDYGKTPPQEQRDPADGNEADSGNPPDTTGEWKWKMSEAQTRRLFAIMKSAGKSDAEMHFDIKTMYAIDSANDLTRDQYDELTASYDRMPKVAK